MGVNRDSTYKVMDKDAFYDKYARLNYGPGERYEFMTDLKAVIAHYSMPVAKPEPPKRKPATRKPRAVREPAGPTAPPKPDTLRETPKVTRGIATTKDL
jgi:hypothetical protein